MTTLFYIAVIFGICAGIAWLDELNDKRQRRRRLERLRELRQSRDQAQPRRWTT